MNKLILHVANTNNELTSEFVHYAKQAINRVETEKIFNILKIKHDVDFLFGSSTKELVRKSVIGFSSILCHELSYVRGFSGDKAIEE